MERFTLSIVLGIALLLSACGGSAPAAPPALPTATGLPAAPDGPEEAPAELQEAPAPVEPTLAPEEYPSPELPEGTLPDPYAAPAQEPTAYPSPES